MEQPTVAAHACDRLPPQTLQVEQAQQRILAQALPLQETEQLPLMAAAGRVLAQTLSARLTVPPFDNSAMDGYAIRYADLAQYAQWRVIGESFAGRGFTGQLQAGECIRIMTGAMLPEGADTVIMQEQIHRQGDTIQITDAIPKLHDNVRYAGDEIRAGDTLLAQGRKLNAADLGLLASQGIDSVSVLRRPRVAFCSTGDELKSLGQPLQAGEIYDSNRYTLHALLQKLDVEILDYGVVPDTLAALETTFLRAQQEANVFITTGGASVGEADYIAETLQRLGQVDFWKIAVKPGKPLAFGRLGSCLFFGLPGNPVSAMATFLLFVRPALLNLRGETYIALPEQTAICETAIKKAPGRKDYQRGICWRDEHGQWRVRSTGDQGSHILRSMSLANCFIVLPLASGSLPANTPVTIIPFEGLL